VPARAVFVAEVADIAITVVVDARSPSERFDGVTSVMVGPETALDRQCCGPGSTSAILVPGGGQVSTMRGRHCPSITLRPLA
jgi:hypothetical protein